MKSTLTALLILALAAPAQASGARHQIREAATHAAMTQTATDGRQRMRDAGMIVTSDIDAEDVSLRRREHIELTMSHWSV